MEDLKKMGEFLIEKCVPEDGEIIKRQLAKLK